MLLVALVVGVPLAGAAASALLGRRGGPAVGLLTAVATATSTVAVAVAVLREGVIVVHGRGPAGLEMVLAADGLAAGMLLMTGVVGVFASAFASAHHRVEPRDGHRAYWPLWLLLWAGLHTLFLAGDLLTIYLMLELIGITGAALVVLGGDARTLVAGSRYFLAELAASVTFLFGIALLWREAGSLVLTELATIAPTPTVLAGLAAMTAGLLLKVPLFPLHFWLPGAHSLAPTAVSPILSAVVVKSAFAVLVRVWFLALPAAVTPSATQLLGGLGAAAIVWGSVNALRTERIKLLLAHSTVAQLGYLFLLPPLVHAGATEAWQGGIIHAIAHGLAKAAALMAAALLVRSAAGERVADLGGTAARRPLATFALGVAGVSLVGVPPSGGFLAKWYLLVASFQTGQWWWAAVIVAGSLLTAAYLMRVVKQTFAPGPAGHPTAVVRDRREVIALLLALTALVLGLRPVELLELLEIGTVLPATGGG